MATDAAPDPAPAPAPPPPPAPAAEPAASTVKRAKAAETAPKRPVLARLFAISIWGAVKLLALCILVGLIVLAANFDPRSPSVDLGETAASLARQAWGALSWAGANLWKPALAGASIVLPLWVLWRLVSLPFRK